MWGFSPTFDILEQISPKPDEKDAIEILLMSPGDIRHVLNTIASRHRWTDRPINIYIHESSMEVLARHLLLLQVAQDWELPLRQRCNLFLEIFGNATVQERTSEYISEIAKSLEELVYNEQGPLKDMIDFSHLKSRNRDDLVDVFRSWKSDVSYDVQTLRDQRLRHYYETRYDFRTNVIDWDYTMELKPITDASVIHIKQYRHWRDTGIAFEFGDQTYTVPNRTMASYVETKERGRGRTLRKGYWLDIIVSPYISFGVSCFRSNKFAEELFEVQNKGTGVEQNRHNTVEVSVFNILSLLHEIETGSIYQMKTRHQVYSGIGEDDAAQDQEEAYHRAETILNSLANVKIIPLTGDPQELLMKSRYRSKMDHMYLSSQAAHLFLPQITDAVLKPNATVSVESST